MKRLAIVATHPIQYNAPVFKLLTERRRLAVKVFYTWEQAQDKIYDADFNREIKWDIPLLEGYAYTFSKNIAKDPGLHHFRGIDNPTLIEEVEAYNPTAILVYGWNFKSHLTTLRHFKNKLPVLFRGDSTLLDDVPGLKSTMRILFLSWIYRHVDKAFFVGQRSREYFLKMGLKEGQLTFAPHAIDNDRFRTSSSEALINAAKITRSGFGITEDALVLVFAGKFEPKKDPFLLLEAFRSLQHPNAHLIMVGNGVLEENLRKACADDANIHFLDFQNQRAMPLIYKLADVFVLPSAGPGETWGLAVNEAMACAKAVVVSDKCGCAVDLVEENVNGFVFKSKSKEDLLNKLKFIASKSKFEVKQMGLASQSKIERWNFEAISEAVEASVIQIST